VAAGEKRYSYVRDHNMMNNFALAEHQLNARLQHIALRNQDYKYMEINREDLPFSGPFPDPFANRTFGFQATPAF
jgi:hypothetical protein